MTKILSQHQYKTIATLKKSQNTQNQSSTAPASDHAAGKKLRRT
jgi:hypothetical protein